MGRVFTNDCRYNGRCRRVPDPTGRARDAYDLGSSGTHACVCTLVPDFLSDRNAIYSVEEDGRVLRIGTACGQRRIDRAVFDRWVSLHDGS